MLQCVGFGEEAAGICADAECSPMIAGIGPQTFDIIVSCAYMAAALQPWIALIVFVLLVSALSQQGDLPMRWSKRDLEMNDMVSKI